jgi:rod shape-determining protein MreD
MTGQLNPRSRSDAFGSKINRTHSPALALATPWLLIMAGSLLPVLPMVSGLPFVPPFGYLFLLAWRLIRPGLLPPWAGIPLGMFDDFYSGQPFGTAILFWSLSLLVIDLLEVRIPWRNFVLDWATASLLVLVYLLARMLLSGAAGQFGLGSLIGPQFLLSVLLYPMIGRIVTLFDRLRLLRIRTID